MELLVFLPFFGAAIQAWVDTYNKIFVNIFKYNLAFSFILVHIIHISLSKYPLLRDLSMPFIRRGFINWYIFIIWI